MKYGMLKYSSATVNLGDYAQLEGIRQAYKKMNIPEQEIIEIERNKISEYDGEEYVILPMCGYFSKLRAISIFPFPPKIIPVYIGFHCVDEDLIQQIAKEHKKFGPFGCRDLVTMKLMRRYGLDAYMSGCMSICYPKREGKVENGKVFLYDAEEVMPFVPERLMKNAEIIGTSFPRMKYYAYDDRNEETAKRTLDERFGRIRKEAELVVTMRLHVALPCIAMGIPVVFAHVIDGAYDNRFAGLDRILKVYQTSDYANIDWNPKPIDLEDIKELTVNLVIQRLREVTEKWGNMCKVSEFYEGASPQIYYEGMNASYINKNQERIQSYDSCERTLFERITKHNFEEMSIVLYGAGDKGKWALRRYYNYFKRSKKFTIVDSAEEKWGKTSNEVMGVEKYDMTYCPDFIIENPEIIRKINRKELVVIVAANRYYEGAGNAIGNLLIKKYGLREGKEFFFLDKMDNSIRLELSEAAKPWSFMDGF